MARGTGPVVPGAARLPAALPPAVRRPGLLHVPLCADRARHADRAEEEHPGADRARRARDPSRDLPRSVRGRQRRRLQHRKREGVPDADLRHPHHRRGDRGMRRGPARHRGSGQATARRRRAPRRSAGGRRRGASARDGEGGRRARQARPRATTGPPDGRPQARHRRGLPAPPPAVRTRRAVRRSHRSGQGLRGTVRVLQHLPPGAAATRRWR